MFFKTFLMQSQTPSFPLSYLFLQPRLFHLLVGSHLAVKQPGYRPGYNCCLLVKNILNVVTSCERIFFFTSFSEHRPAQREWAQTRLISPMQGAIPTQSHYS